MYFQDLRNDPTTIQNLKLYQQEPVKTEDGKFMAKQINAVAYLGGFLLHLQVFTFVYQFYTKGQLFSKGYFGAFKSTKKNMVRYLKLEASFATIYFEEPRNDN